MKRVAVVGLLTLALAVFVAQSGLVASSAQGPRTSAVGTSTSVPSATSTVTATSSVTTTTTSITRPIENPFKTSSLANYLATRSDVVTAALYNESTHLTYIYHPGVREVTASMAKIDILADLLWESQTTGHPLSENVEKLATAMIEYSDNKAAQTLYVRIGQLPAITTFNQSIGFTQTIESWDWGLIDTTPRDQLNLLKTILFPNHVLNTASQSYEQNLMENVADYERFGIPTGVPANAMVGVKNGWDPESTTGWQINSSGYVHLGHTYYLAVVMTQSNPSEAYGEEVVDRVAEAFWNFESSHTHA
jgi:beta-lactamase class A